MKDGRELLAATPLSAVGKDNVALPVSMAIDSNDKDENDERVVVGFEDGSFSVHALRRGLRRFDNLFTHPPSSNGMLEALAMSSPYLLTMTEDHLLSLYAFEEKQKDPLKLAPPKLLYSLRSHTAWPPVSLSLRTTVTSMTAAIAYSLPTYLSGWTVGVQELNLSHKGELLGSRLATAADGHAFTLSNYLPVSSSSTRSSSLVPTTPRGPPSDSTQSNSKPISMSYSHPYLLVAHSDNTLSLYLVKSTASNLSIGPGDRLWGHTSSISGAHVGVRGKAVSVSRLGDELRLWDLEGGTASLANRRRFKSGELSVRVQPSRAGDDTLEGHDVENERNVGLRYALDQTFDDSSVNCGWVGFDEQNVVVLREKSEGSQALVVYDFT